MKVSWNILVLCWHLDSWLVFSTHSSHNCYIMRMKSLSTRIAIFSRYFKVCLWRHFINEYLWTWKYVSMYVYRHDSHDCRILYMSSCKYVCMSAFIHAYVYMDVCFVDHRFAAYLYSFNKWKSYYRKLLRLALNKCNMCSKDK